MKNIKGLLLIFTLVFISISCEKSKKSTELISAFYEGVICSPEPMPDYDVINVILVEKNHAPEKDTTVRQIEKRRDAFKPCRQIIYRAIWKSKSGKIITNSRTKMMATGLRWEVEPEIQDEIILQYEFSEYDKEQTKKFQLNKEILDRR